MFPLDHWSQPRKTIASIYKDDDLAYGIHGGHMALQCLTALEVPLKGLKGSTLLDFGCGTGRVTRVLSPSFKKSYGYDPNRACILNGKRECPNMQLSNMSLHNSLDQIPECDYTVCVNVIEHLDKTRADEALNIIKNKTKKLAVIFWHREHNAHLAPFFESYGRLAFPESTGKIAVSVVDFSWKVNQTGSGAVC